MAYKTLEQIIRGVQYNAVMAEGAGEEGTSKLRQKYAADTPGQLPDVKLAVDYVKKPAIASAAGRREVDEDYTQTPTTQLRAMLRQYGPSSPQSIAISNELKRRRSNESIVMIDINQLFECVFKEV